MSFKLNSAPYVISLYIALNNGKNPVYWTDHDSGSYNITTENGTIAINFNSISITVPHKYQNSIKNNMRCFLKVLVFTSAVRNNAKAIE